MGNCSNIMPLIDADEDLQSLFSSQNTSTISEKLNDGLNRIANKLIIKKKNQNRKEDQRLDDLELKNLRNMIRQQSKIAHSTGDLKEQRYLKNLKNRYSRKEKQKKKKK